jgi:pimeloyl-ACP methyl ester carboxylesterase
MTQEEVELREQRFQTGMVELNYAEGPATGRPLVFLHGGSSRWQYGIALLEELAPQWHVYAPDMRGHGSSGRVPGGYRLLDYVADITAFLEQVVKAPAVIISQSMGGHVGIMLTAQHPSLVRALIVGDSPPLSGTTVPAHAPGAHDELIQARELAASDRSTLDLAAVLEREPVQGAGHPSKALVGSGRQLDWASFRAELLKHADPEVIATTLDPQRINEGYDAERLLPAIHCPVLLVQGDPDAGGLMPHEEVPRALALIPQGQHVFLKDIGHAWLHDQPERGRKAIADFLAAL